MVLEAHPPPAMPWPLMQTPPQLCRTITPHHLQDQSQTPMFHGRAAGPAYLACRCLNGIFAPGWPCAGAATSGPTRNFFSATDSAPHPACRNRACGCAGISFNCPPCPWKAYARCLSRKAPGSSRKAFASPSSAPLYCLTPNAGRLELRRFWPSMWLKTARPRQRRGEAATGWCLFRPERTLHLAAGGLPESTARGVVHRQTGPPGHSLRRPAGHGATWMIRYRMLRRGWTNGIQPKRSR